MELRPELNPPVLDEEQVQRLVDFINSIEDSLEIGDDPSEFVSQFNREVGTNFKYDELCEIWSYMEVEEFVRSQLRTSQARKIPDITYEELLELMNRVCKLQGTESEVAFYTRMLEKNLPIEDLWVDIFWQSSDRKLSSQEYLDRALAFRPKPPLITPPPIDTFPQKPD